MRCSEVREQLSSYMDGMLSADQMQAVDEHLSLCPDCRTELQQLEETVSLLHQLGEVEPPADLQASIINRIQATGKKDGRVVSIWNRFKGRGSLGGLAAVAACLLLVAVVFSGGIPNFRMATDSGVTEEAADGASDFLGSALPGGGDQGVEMEMYTAREGPAPDSPRLTMETEPEVERKIIKRAHMSLLVEDLDRDFEQIVTLVEEAGGFVQNSGTWENDRQRSSNLTIRVPVDSFSRILAQLEEMGRVEGRQLDGRDVTTEYVDTEARLRNLQRQEERFLEILNQADTVEDILNIERELERVRGEVEALTARLKNLDDLTSLSTIDIELRQLKVSAERIAPPGLQGVLDAAYEAAVSTVNGILNFLGELVIFLGRILPFLPLVLLAWFGYRRYQKGRRGTEE